MNIYNYHLPTSAYSFLQFGKRGETQTPKKYSPSSHSAKPSRSILRNPSTSNPSGYNAPPYSSERYALQPSQTGDDIAYLQNTFVLQQQAYSQAEQINDSLIKFNKKYPDWNTLPPEARENKRQALAEKLRITKNFAPHKSDEIKTLTMMLGHMK